MPAAPHRSIAFALLCALASALSASDASPTQSGSDSAAAAGTIESQLGEHRRGQRVEYELAPAKVRATFEANNGEHLSCLVKRSDASGQPIYCALVRDTDQSLVVLSVAEDGHLVDKQPPRRHVPWQASDEDQWSGEADTGLWSLADGEHRRGLDDNPLLERRAQSDQIGGSAPVGSLSSADH